MSPSITTRRTSPATRLLLAVYLYVFMEWLFLVTKPSFMIAMSWIEKIAVGLAAALIAGVLALVAYAAFAVLLTAIPSRHSKTAARLRELPRAVVFAALGLLLVDNFSLTMVGLGVRDTKGVGALVYLALWIAAGVGIWRRLARSAEADGGGQPGTTIALVLVFASVAASASLILSARDWAPDVQINKQSLPDILLFASDGVDANFLSAYGYKFETSPNLDRLVPESLVFRAAVSNAARTTGSTTAMLTGKYPTTTKVLFPPHTLRGADAFEHLPAILRRLGYRSFQSSIRYYADAPDLNMREAFDYANRRAVPDALPDWMPPRAAVAFADTRLLLERFWSRIEDRVLHLSLRRSMQDVFRAVSSNPAQVYGFRDKTRINQARLFIRNNDGPLFMHIHLMNTHCCRFRPTASVFSPQEGKQDQRNWALYFADAILESDGYFGDVLAELEAQGRLENTLIVYSSDHGINWRVNQRMPLVMRFPGGEHTGEVKTPVQLLDVAPTILDFLEVPIPEWMEGTSLIAGTPDKLRPLFSVEGVNREMMKTGTDTVSRLVGSGPPNYGMKSMLMTVCDSWYSLDLESGAMERGRIARHPVRCPGNEVPGRKSARRLFDRHLAERGLPKPPPAADQTAGLPASPQG